MSVALVIAAAFMPAGYAADDVTALEAKFKKARTAYVKAQEALSDAQIDSLLTTGKSEKDEARKKISTARQGVKKAKEDYKKALSALHDAETARDAKIDRSPWN